MNLSWAEQERKKMAEMFLFTINEALRSTIETRHLTPHQRDKIVRKVLKMIKSEEPYFDMVTFFEHADIWWKYDEINPKKTMTEYYDWSVIESQYIPQLNKHQGMVMV